MSDDIDAEIIGAILMRDRAKVKRLLAEQDKTMLKDDSKKNFQTTIDQHISSRGFIDAGPKKKELNRLLAAIGRIKRPADSMTTIQWKLTPALARELLDDGGTADRSLSAAVVRCYSHDMANGNWRASHQGMGIGPRGERGDGQHRCEACIESGKTVDMSFTQYHTQHGFDAARRTWDLQRKRSKANILEYLGLVPKGQGKAFASTLETVAMVDSRMLAKPTSDDIVDAFYRHQTALKEVNSKLCFRDFRASIRAAMTIAWDKDPKEVENLINAISLKEGLKKKTVALFIVNHLRDLQGSGTRRNKTHAILAMLNLIHKHIHKQDAPAKVIRTSTEATNYFLGTNFRGSDK